MKITRLPGLCLALIAFTACITACFDVLDGSGISKSETRSVAPFSRISLTGSPEVEVTVGQAQSVTVTTDDNLLPIIETISSGGTLEVHSTSSYNSHLGVKVIVSVPSLEEVWVTGSGVVRAAGLQAANLTAKVTGSGEIRLQGGSDRLQAEVTGSGNVRADDLAAKNVSVNITGSGEVSVRSTDNLDAHVTGSGTVRYSGSPQAVHRSITGSGQITAQ